jgi:ribosomal protein S12 methylthiotransferase accessory factor
VPDKAKILISIPHDQEVDSFPFSDLPFSNNFRRIYNSLNSEGILGKLEQSVMPADVPQFYVYACQRSSGENKVNVSYGFGGSEDESRAIISSIGEAVEHYCILHERKDFFIHNAYEKLKSEAIDPLRFVPFTQKQLKSKRYKKFNISHSDSINWLEGYSLTNCKKVLLPASLAYANYSCKKHNELGIIRMPISTGAACGPSLDSAINRGICEIIERDGYMISFLPQMPKRIILIDKFNTELSDFIRRFTRYNFELYFIDTTLDSKVFSVVCLLIDRSGSGPAVCAGLGGGFVPTNAIKTSAIEALRRYVSDRNSFFRSEGHSSLKKYSFEWFIRNKHKVWSAPHMIKLVEDLVKNAKKTKLPREIFINNEKEKRKYLTEKLKSLGCELFYIDMTIPEVDKQGLKVVKVLCPEMVPLWYDERYPYFGMERLITVPEKSDIKVNLNLNVKELTNIHPF